MITSKEFFINMKLHEIPTEDSRDFFDFWDNERNKCLAGVNVNGVFINPFLYWHLNFWNLEIDYKEMVLGRERTVQKFTHPILRDNDWLITNAIYEAEQAKKGLCILGSRRLGKTSVEASYLAYGATMDRGSQNVLAGLNSDDIALVAGACDKGLRALPDYFRFDTRVDDNWKKQVTLGVKDKSGKRIPWSSILIRNLDYGENPEAIAGTKPRKLVIDEIGKGPWLEGFLAAIPGFTSSTGGWACSPLVFGTSGDMDSYKDAQTAFLEPHSFNFLELKNEETGKTHGLFLGHKYRYDAKKQSTLAEFLGKEGEELEQIRMDVSDLELADKITDAGLERAKKSNDSKAYLKERMYFPKTIEDMFLSVSDNDFPIEAINEHLQWMEANDVRGTAIELFKDSSGVVKHKFSEKLPILNFPHKKDDNLDAPIMVYEFPIDTDLDYLYVAGIDPYNQSQAAYSDSLASVYIYKRTVDVLGESFQNMIVASYTARPPDIKTWYETVDMLMEFYNATAMVENENPGFIQYMDQKNEGYRLADGMSFVREISPNTTLERPKGLPATIPVIKFSMEQLVGYTKEMVVPYAKDGVPVKKLGVTRILDPMLLAEMKKYDGKDKKINTDRIVAARIALVYAHFLDKFFPTIGMKSEQKEKPNPFKPSKMKSKSPFISTKNPFINMKY